MAGILKNTLTQHAQQISFEAMRAHLDRACVGRLTENVWPEWEIMRGLTLNPDLASLIIQFRCVLYRKPITEAYEYHGLTTEQVQELEGMVRAFDELTRG